MEKYLFNFLIPFLILTNGISSSSRITPNVISCIEDKKWYLNEIRAIQDNKNYYYRRDNPYAGNMNFDNDYIIFQTGGSGIYHQSDGMEYKLSWNRIDNIIDFTIYSFRNKKDLFVTWEKIETKENLISYTEFYTHANGINSLAVCTRITEDVSGYVSKEP